MNFFKGLKFAIPISLMLWLMLFFTINVFAAKPVVTTEKVDDYHIKVIVTKEKIKNGETITTVREKTKTINEINAKKAQHTGAQQSWVDSQNASEILVEENLATQQEEIDALDEMLTDCTSLGIIEIPAWLTNTAYSADDMVVEGEVNYKCLVGHTSGIFADDLAAGKWEAE
jgi:16S rRNA U1498 N3-methylase RsmE